MKKMVIIAALLMAVAGVKAQDCEAIMLPYFGNDATRMARYQTEAPYKFEWRCAYAKAAFYESDTVPAGADVFQISEVKEAHSDKLLNSNFVVDMNTLSYYAYNFKDFQLRYPHVDKVVCFSTPGSAHPYLVLRSVVEMHSLANEMTSNNESN